MSIPSAQHRDASRKRFGWKTLVALGILGVPRPAVACMGCTDAAMDFLFPWVWPMSMALLAWLAVGWWRWTTLSAITAADATEPGRANPNAIVMFSCAFGVAMVVGVLLLLPYTGLMGLVCMAWLVFLMWSLTRSFRRQNWPSASRLFHRMNLICLVLAFLVGGAGWVVGSRPEAAVEALRIGPHSDLVIPYVLKAGDQSVPALIAAIDDAFDRLNEPLQPGQIVPYVWCLTRIGGPDADAALSKLLETRIHDTAHGDGRWQLVVACLIAESGGADAVPPLKQLYDREPDKGLRQIALGALARTGSRAGALFAIDHLVEMVPDNFDGESTIHPVTAGVVEVIARILAGTRDLRLLKTVELFNEGPGRRSMFGLPMNRPSADSSAELPSDVLADSLIDSIQQLSTEDLQALRDAWEHILADVKTES